jgi:hypothetical protein
MAPFPKEDHSHFFAFFPPSASLHGNPTLHIERFSALRCPMTVANQGTVDFSQAISDRSLEIAFYSWIILVYNFREYGVYRFEGDFAGKPHGRKAKW